MSASSPSSSFSTSARTVASPHSTRCSPQIQRSPGRLIGSAGGSGASSGSPSAIGAEQQLLQLEFAEAGQPEVDAQALQLAQLERQQLLVPAGIQRQLVVGDDVGSPLRLGPAGRDHHRDLGEPQPLGRQHAPVAGDDRSGLVDQDRHRPSPLPDRGRDLGDLLVGMGPGVARVRHQGRHGPALHGVGRPPGLSRGDRAGFFAGTAALRPLSGHCCPSAEGPETGLFLEVLADGKNSLREPPARQRAPKAPRIRGPPACAPCASRAQRRS